MPEHRHRCLACTPELVPAFDPADPRYHEVMRCGARFRVTLGGADVAYTHGAFEGPEGWVLYAGATAADVHVCACAGGELCVEPLFGPVEVRHACPKPPAVAEVP